MTSTPPTYPKHLRSDADFLRLLDKDAFMALALWQAHLGVHGDRFAREHVTEAFALVEKLTARHGDGVLVHIPQVVVHLQDARERWPDLFHE